MENSYFNWKQKKIQEEQAPIDPPTDVPSFIRTKETGDKVYVIKDGYAHWITSPEILKTVGGDFGKVETIDKALFRRLGTGEKITSDNVVKFIVDKETEGMSSQESSSEIDKKEYTLEEALPSQHEFKTYEQQTSKEEVESAPKEEPEKGFTSIIIPVHWNHYPAFHYTGNCIGSIREHTNKDKTPYEIILVINGKTGIQVDRLEQTYADKVIQNEENLGFAKAVNKGIRVARGEYIAIVNNDVMVFNKWLELLQMCLNQAKQLDLVMATPMYGKPFARAVEARELANKHIGKMVEETFDDFKDFSCVLTRKKVFSQIGLFDEQFFYYGEDLDLMRRMDKAGMKYASTKLVNTFHIIGATSSGMDETPEVMNESKEKLKIKWGY